MTKIKKEIKKALDLHQNLYYCGGVHVDYDTD